MQKPPPLQPGSRVRVLAPASPFDPDKLERGLDRLGKLGLVVERAPHLQQRVGYLAGSDEQRAGDLIEALQDPQVTAIWCARGGYGCTRLLPRLAGIQPSGPKLIIGFSDVSALLALWLTRYGMSAVHGPVLTSLVDEPEASVAHLWRVLQGQATGTRLSLEPDEKAAPVEGTLFASNLTVLTHLCGTPYLPDLSGCILCVEDVGERPYRLDRCWTQIRQSGLLSGLSAIVLGRFAGCDDADGSITSDQGLGLGLDGVSVPVRRGLDIGHRPPNLAIPVGVRARISGAALTLLEEVTADDLDGAAARRV